MFNLKASIMEEQYIRVGTTIYKVVQQPLADGTMTTRRLQWSFGTIRQDYGKHNIPTIDNIMVFAQCQVTQTTKRMLQVSIICMNQLTMFRQKGISLILKNCYTTSLRSNTNWGWTICSCFICSRLRNSPSCYWCQRNETQERPLS